MSKRLMILVGVLATLLVVAAPVMAQAETEEAVVAGVIQPVASPTVEGPTHVIVEDGTGDEYGLFSDAQGVDLSQYEGQLATVYGIFQTQGNPISNFDDPTEVPIYVTAVEIPDEGPYETEYAEIAGVISPNPEATVPGGEIPSHLITEDATGDVYMLHGGEVDLRLYEGMHVTIYGPFQTLGGPLPPDPTEIPIFVTSLEVIQDAEPPAYPDAKRVPVTFELTVQSAVPEGRTLGLGYAPIGNMPADFKGVAFCTTDSEDTEGLPVCEAGETYTGTLKVPVGFEFSYDFLYNVNYNAVRCDYMGPTEVFYSDTQVFTEATTVSATYTEDGLPEGCRVVGEAPAVEDQYQDSGDNVEEPVSEGAGENVAPDDTASDGNVLSVLPDTGGFSPAILGLVALLLAGGSGLLAYGYTRR